MAKDRPAIGILAAQGLTGVAFVLRWALDDILPPAFPFLTFFPAIVASAFLFGLRSGLVAGVLGYLLSRMFFIHTPDGAWFSPSMAAAMLLYAIVAASILTAIHLMQVAFRQLSQERETSRQLAEDRELLMREMHHRVGNNLQLLASLLALQKRTVSEPETLRALDDASRRIGLVGRVQRQLHAAEAGELSLGPFVNQLCKDLIDASGRGNVSYALDEHVRCHLSTDLAIPIALVLAEAVSNAVEHGFAEDRAGHIAIMIAREAEDLVIRIDDDGKGLPPGFAMKDRTSLGLTIATLLARRVGGQFRVERGVGARAVLTMPFPVSSSA